MPKPQTLEEALAVIETLETKVATVIQEKKDVIELFNKDEKEGMTDTEKKLAESLETERSARLALEESLKKSTEERTAQDNKRIADEASRVQKLVEERIEKASKGDTAVADKLKANVALLEKLPRTTDSEIDALMGTAYNMLGTKEANPFAQTGTTTSGDANIQSEKSFSDTGAGKTMAGKLGLTETAKVETGAEGDK